MILFQKDAELESKVSEPSDSLDAVDAAMQDEGTSLSASERARARETAERAWKRRRVADEFMRRVAPAWPPHRMPAVDRAIIRLAFDEMTEGGVNPKIAVNEAIELAKRFSTDRSPAFVNALLDKALKELQSQADAPQPGGAESVEA